MRDLLLCRCRVAWVHAVRAASRSTVSSPHAAAATAAASTYGAVRRCSTGSHKRLHSGGSTADEGSDDAMELVWAAVSDATEPKATHSAATDATSPPPSPPPPDNTRDAASPVWVSLHNLPRNWLHEDILNMIHQVAEHAGVAATATPELGDARATASGDVDVDGNGAEDEDSDMLSRVVSPFVRRLHIPFGRRTGLVYGTPKLLLTPPQLARYLVDELHFGPDDFRSRVYFTYTTPDELPGGHHRAAAQHATEDDATAAPRTPHTDVAYAPIEETVEREKEEALRTLELDRYLFAPDLLLDIAKSHQRRLVTKNERVLLDAFVDGTEDEQREAEDEAADGAAAAAAAAAAATTTMRRRRTSRDRAVRRVRAGTQKHLGRGSMHNMPIPKPYVQGRTL
ncbi:hypothetical protein NESM_000699400 [Novymonas esmeraldas]|uniref:Uncharacterized protein n=1 Tax=Novymonas esmeraldas TaxID=1808958 RepID=A0AAW0EUV7_9TRYP